MLAQQLFTYLGGKAGIRATDLADPQGGSGARRWVAFPVLEEQQVRRQTLGDCVAAVEG
nr:hypothetical protein [uncultured Lichenicoccus sp.]